MPKKNTDPLSPIAALASISDLYESLPRDRAGLIKKLDKKKEERLAKFDRDTASKDREIRKRCTDVDALDRLLEAAGGVGKAAE